MFFTFAKEITFLLLFACLLAGKLKSCRLILIIFWRGGMCD